MGADQTLCLFLMFLIGIMAFPTTAFWADMNKWQRGLLIAWVAFWLGPPIYFVWTKGVMG